MDTEGEHAANASRYAELAHKVKTNLAPLGIRTGAVRSANAMSALAKNRATPSYVHITGVISSSYIRKGGGRELTIFFPDSNRTYQATCYLKLPIRKGDFIDGTVRLDEAGVMHIENLLFIEPSCERKDVVKCFTYALEIGDTQSGNLYSQIYRSHPKAEAVVTYLNDLALTLRTEDKIDPLPTLTKEQTCRLLTWWYRDRCMRTLELLGLTKDEINNPYQSCVDVMRLCYSNPYAVLSLPLPKCDLLMTLFKKEIDPLHRICGEIARFLLKRAEDGSACVPKLMLLRHYPGLLNYESLLKSEYTVVADLDSYYLASVHNIESQLVSLCVSFVQRSPPPPRTYVVPAKLSDDQHAAVVGALHQRFSVITGTAGTGKCLGYGTLVLKSDGSVVPVQELTVGDKLMGPEGKERVLTSLARGEDHLYRITPEDSDDANTFVCNEAHILTLASPLPLTRGRWVYYFVRGRSRIQECPSKEAAQEFADKLERDIFDISVSEYLYRAERCLYQLYYQGVPHLTQPEHRLILSELAPGTYSSSFANIEERDAFVHSARAWGCRVRVESALAITFIIHEQGRYFVPFTVQPLGMGPYYGFELTGDGRFLLHDFLVTHNTTCLAEIVRQLQIYNIEHLICSFTGKAVARIREVTKLRTPMTIHRAIMLAKKEEDALRYDFLVIDEASMVTVSLFYELMCAYPSLKQVVLIGDDNQLSPIGWGALFEQLIASRTIPLFRLTINHRVYQNNGASDGITYNAHRLISAKGIGSANFAFTETSNFAVLEGGIDLVYDIMKGCYAADIKAQQVIVLTPYNEHIIPLNRQIQNIFNAVEDKTEDVTSESNDSLSSPTWEIDNVKRTNQGLCVDQQRVAVDSAGFSWRLHDKVMMTKNNYSTGVYNGEMGIIIGVSKEDITVDFGAAGAHHFLLQRSEKKWEDGKDENHEPEQTVALLTLGYAISIDKSQGSEWDFVVIYFPINRETSFLNCQRTFTAMTRAKRAVWIITSDRDGLHRAAIRAPPRRHEHISTRLRQQLPCVVEEIKEIKELKDLTPEQEALLYFQDEVYD